MPRPNPSTAAPKNPHPMTGRIAAVLKVVAALIAHARYFTATAGIHAATPEFATAAAVFGTYNLPTILHRMQRGLLRALALQQYLIERAARGCDLRFAWRSWADIQPHHRPPPRPTKPKRPAPRLPRRPEPALFDHDDPRASRLPTPQELAAEVRRRPVGRTMVYICLDLGLAPGLCEGEFWNQVEKIFRRYGGSLYRLCRIRERREVAFRRERDRMPDTWHINWRDFSPDNVRRALGCRFGEPPPDGTGPPIPVPS